MTFSASVIAVLVHADGTRERVALYPGNTFHGRFERGVYYYPPEWSGPLDAEYVWLPLNIRGESTGRVAYFYRENV